MYDRFHISQHLNDAVDSVRRAENVDDEIDDHAAQP
ncbi:transposase [Thiolapillus sp.]